MAEDADKDAKGFGSRRSQKHVVRMGGGIRETCRSAGYLVRTPEESEKATEAGFREKRVTIINLIIEAGKGAKLKFGWQASGGKKKSKL